MFSKKLWIALGLVFTTILLNCSGDNQKAKVPELKAGGCLSNTPEDFDRFLKGQSTPKDVTQFWTCMQKTVDTFEKYTQGEKQDSYKATEIRSFLQTYFLGNIKITDRLLQEFMQIKRLLVKGNSEVITRAEIYRVHRVMDQLHAMTLRLAPHMEVFSSDHFSKKAKSPLGREQFKAAQIAFESALQEIAEIVRVNQESYDLSRIGILLEELDNLSKQQQVKNSQMDGLAQYAPLITSLKAALISQPGGVLEATSFPAAMKMASDMLFVYLQSKYYLNNSWDHGEGLTDLERIVDHGLQILQDGVERKPDQKILFTEIDPILTAMGQLEMIPLDLKASTAQSTLKVLLQKIFKSAAVTQVDGLSVDGVKSIKQEWNGFVRAQKFAEASWSQGQWADPKGSVDALELMRAATSPFPLEKDTLGRLVLKNPDPNWFWDRNSLTSLNWQRLLIHMLVKGYATGDNLTNLVGLTKDQLMAASKDFFPLGIDVGFFSADKPDIYKRIFQEANLFMPRANGDSLVNYEEGVDYLAYALSGINARDEFLRISHDICPVEIVKDERQMDANCFRGELDAHRNLYFANLPELTKSFVGLPDSKWADLEKNFETTVRKNGYQPTPVTTGEIVQLFILAQYLETFMLRFDATQSQALNLTESLVAFEVYKGTLKELLAGFVTTDDEILNIYTFMFNYGETPLSGIGGMLKYVNWRVKREQGLWAYEADRVRLSQILSSLSAL